MKPTKITIATHGHCFDGMASAALFTHLLRSLRPGAPLEMRYRSCGYGPGMQMIPEEWLDGDENAILDFRYTPSKRLTWYFDHHITGFGSAEERDLALQRAAPPSAESKGPHVFYDAAYGSCTKLIADVARAELGVDMASHSQAALSDLIAWADKIDTARFESAEAAVSRKEPVLMLASVVEHHGDAPFLTSIVPELLAKPVREVASSPVIQELFRPLLAAQEAFIARVEKAAKPMGRVVWVDLSDALIEAAAKFVTYALYPTSMYSVVLLRGRQHYKMSIGYNPWCGAPRLHDISAICRRYNGGGHAAVGAASFPLSALEQAKQAALAVIAELNA
jgi:hypothetical protein